MITRLWRRFCFHTVQTGNLEVAREIDAEIERRELQRRCVPSLFQVRNPAPPARAELHG